MGSWAPTTVRTDLDRHARGFDRRAGHQRRRAASRSGWAISCWVCAPAWFGCPRSATATQSADRQQRRAPGHPRLRARAGGLPRLVGSRRRVHAREAAGWPAVAATVADRRRGRRRFHLERRSEPGRGEQVPVTVTDADLVQQVPEVTSRAWAFCSTAITRRCGGFLSRLQIPPGDLGDLVQMDLPRGAARRRPLRSGTVGHGVALRRGGDGRQALPPLTQAACA